MTTYAIYSAAGQELTQTERVDLLLVLGALKSARSIAGSALTQRPARKA